LCVFTSIRHTRTRWPVQAVEFVMALHNHEGDLLSECPSFITMPLKYAHDPQNIIDPNQKREAQLVDYAPGGASPSHTHAKSAFVFAYVLSGEIESQVNDGPKRVYRAGESWYETPASIHRVSRNASKTEPAKLLAVFVVDTDDKNLTTPVKE